MDISKYGMAMDKLLFLYEKIIQEEQFWIDDYRKEVRFFWSIISAIFAGTVIGIFKATEWFHYLFLALAPMLAISTSYIMKVAIDRSYQRFLEAIAQKAKIESRLDIVNSDGHDCSFWSGEPIISSRHISSWKKFDSSLEFIRHHIAQGSNRVYTTLIYFVRILSSFLLLFLVSMAFYEWYR